MGTVYRETYTKPLPEGAEVFTRDGECWARWKARDRKGNERTRTARVTVPESGEHAGTRRLLFEARTYTAKYRDGAGHVVKIGTGCRDADAARGVLRELERRAELVRGNLLSSAEARTADFQGVPIGEHIDAYATFLQTRASSAKHRATVIPRLRRLALECGFRTLHDLKRARLEAWLANAPESMAARTRNGYVTALTSFCNWAVSAGRMVVNPFHRMHRANERTDQRRPRRAMTAGELGRLIDVARCRPLAECGRKPIRVERPEGEPRKRASWTYEPVTPDNLGECQARARERFNDRPDVLAEAEAIGRLRALTYKTLALTGLRLGELQSITVGHAQLDGADPVLTLKAADEKARRGAEIILRADLAADLSRHLAERLRVAQRAAGRENNPIPARLPADAPLIDIPDALVKVFNRDLVAAGIASAVRRKGKWRADKQDALGRGLDIHCLRHTFNSLLAAAGVPLTTRRILMRHAAQGITDGHYTDKTLIDLQGALDQLPLLPLDGPAGRELQRATGTCDAHPVEVKRDSLVPGLVPNTGNCCTLGAHADQSGSAGLHAENAVSDGVDTSSGMLSHRGKLHRPGLEPGTFGSVGRRSIQLS